MQLASASGYLFHKIWHSRPSCLLLSVICCKWKSFTQLSISTSHGSIYDVARSTTFLCLPHFLLPSHAIYQTLLTHHLIFNSLYLYPFTSPNTNLQFQTIQSATQILLSLNNNKIQDKDKAPQIWPQNTVWCFLRSS